MPTPLPDASVLGRKPSLPGQWVDLPPPLAGALKEPFEIKVYEIDDVERLQRHRPPPRDSLAEVGFRGCGRLRTQGPREVSGQRAHPPSSFLSCLSGHREGSSEPQACHSPPHGTRDPFLDGGRTWPTGGSLP